MKRYTLYSIVAILLLALAVSGSTYAYLTTRASTNNSLATSVKGLNVIYDSGTPIDGNINVVSSKEQGYNTTVKIKLAQNSVAASATLYIDIERITQNIAIPGFIWEVYGYKNGVEVYSNHGNFANYNDTNNKIVNIVRNYELSEEETSFVVYFWLDGNKTNNDVLDGQFKAYIGARSENITGILGSHTVTFNPNGGSVDTPSKLVQYGSTYGQLPTPTKDGYTFKGWNGKNLFNIDEVNINKCISNKGGTFYPSSTFYSMSIDNNIVTVVGQDKNASLYMPVSLVINSKQYTLSFNASQDRAIYIADNDLSNNYPNRIRLTQSNNPVNNSFTFNAPQNGLILIHFSADTDLVLTPRTVANIQLEEGSTATAYEPYYITPSTEVVQDQDHTLTAIWEPVS